MDCHLHAVGVGAHRELRPASCQAKRHRVIFIVGGNSRDGPDQIKVAGIRAKGAVRDIGVDRLTTYQVTWRCGFRGECGTRHVCIGASRNNRCSCCRNNGQSAFKSRLAAFINGNIGFDFARGAF